MSDEVCVVKVPFEHGHDSPVAPNLLDQQFIAQRPDVVWHVDITYIATAEGWLISRASTTNVPAVFHTAGRLKRDCPLLSGYPTGKSERVTTR